MFEKTRPLYPNQIPVGAFKCSKGNVLSQDYLDFVQGNYLTVASFLVKDSLTHYKIDYFRLTFERHSKKIENTTHLLRSHVFQMVKQQY